MEPKISHSSSCQAGFTLVEIMVGLVIGMLVTLVILQVMTAFEAQKRTTTGTADAQTNGGIALYTIGRDLQMAGYPLIPVTDSPLECTTLTFGATGITGIAPVTITDGGAAAGASDTITLRYGNAPMGGIPTQILGIVGQALTIGYTLPGNNVGCTNGDTVLIANQNICAMTSLPTVAGLTGTTIVNLVDNSAVAAGVAVNNANISCLGAWHEITYKVNATSGNMERQDLASPPVDPAIPVPAFSPSVTGIVNIQAQYGISASTDSNQVTQWVEATAATGWNAPIVSAVKAAANNRNRIKAIRIAVVARNPKKEAGNVTNTCTTAKGIVNKGPCAWDDTNFDAAPKIDLSSDADWQRYRYRVFETIIPLRNVIWSRVTL